MKTNMERSMGFYLGAGGGLTKFLMQINTESPFVWKLMQAGVTALVCGILGAAGTHLYGIIFKKKSNEKIN